MEYRVDTQAAYILHLRPYLETSAIVDFFTLNNGRVSAVVKGIRRPRSKLKGVLQPFVPLQISWQGKQELKTLIHAEAVGLNGILQGNALMCGLYVNELMQRQLSPFDPHPKLYVYYQYVLNELLSGEDIQGALRTFERRLLSETGFGLPLSDIQPLDVYLFNMEQWCFERVSQVPDPLRRFAFRGQDLLAIAADCYDTPAQQQAAKRLMRLAIDHLLADRPLRSRALFQ
ncbi:DNA repair protein RecO [Neptunomonas concharum]|uniref:DNA repair protein RecO n=1 Tax=Neptunomonas concharum TaxID=1031538 RepID=A0A5P1RDC3_9GAMM|nr:DNA repair protein RecO [Neptunomonas concharum]QEQ97638.1 DNA repair protein RecO [Neptunomonas concharum]